MSDEIRAVVAIMLPPEDAEYLCQMIDFIEASAKRQGGSPISDRLHRVRSQLAAGVAAVLGSHRCEDDVISSLAVSESDRDVLLDTATAAEMIGLKRTTILMHCGNGKLGQKVGREWVIRLSELKEFQRDRLERKGEVA
jgi:Helix-turn-helix domain